jgi:hypothetical protein
MTTAYIAAPRKFDAYRVRKQHKDNPGQIEGYESLAFLKSELLTPVEQVRFFEVKIDGPVIYNNGVYFFHTDHIQSCKEAR